LLASHFRPNPVLAAGIFAAVSFAGLATSYLISPVPACDPKRKFDWFFPAEVWIRMSEVRSTDRTLHLAIIGNVYFWFIAALLQFEYSRLRQISPRRGRTAHWPANGRNRSRHRPCSLAAGYLSSNKIEYGLIPSAPPA